MYIKVGTFGVASAYYYWPRAATAKGRIAQCIPRMNATTWHQPVADDLHLEASGQDYRVALVSFFVLCSAAGAPLSRGRTAGSDAVTWVSSSPTARTTWGSQKERQHGSSDGRKKSPASKRGWRRPGTREAIPREKNFLSYLSSQVSQPRLYNCAMEVRAWETAPPRVDARASEGKTGVGTSTRRSGTPRSRG